MSTPSQVAPQAPATANLTHSHHRLNGMPIGRSGGVLRPAPMVRCSLALQGEEGEILNINMRWFAVLAPGLVGYRLPFPLSARPDWGTTRRMLPTSVLPLLGGLPDSLKKAGRQVVVGRQQLVKDAVELLL